MKKVLVVYSKSFKLKKILPDIFTNVNKMFVDYFCFPSESTYSTCNGYLELIDGFDKNFKEWVSQGFKYEIIKVKSSLELEDILDFLSDESYKAYKTYVHGVLSSILIVPIEEEIIQKIKNYIE